MYNGCPGPQGALRLDLECQRAVLVDQDLLRGRPDRFPHSSRRSAPELPDQCLQMLLSRLPGEVRDPLLRSLRPLDVSLQDRPTVSHEVAPSDDLHEILDLALHSGQAVLELS